MSQSALFQPARVRNLELQNRIVIAPMCQYSAEDGCMNDWHLIHLGQLALSGAALLTIEATAVLERRLPKRVASVAIVMRMERMIATSSALC